MKRFLSLTALLGSLVIFTPSSAEAKAAVSLSSGETAVAVNAAAQPGRRRYQNRRVRVFNQTRIVRRGRAVYREVYQYRYRANGRVTVRLISRTRIR